MLMILIVTIMFFATANSTEKLDSTAITNLSDAKDGTYIGKAETPMVKAEVSVSIINHKITDIKLLKHENGKGTDAERMLPNMIENNTSEVDEVTGATMSSKVIKAAVRDALAKSNY